MHSSLKSTVKSVARRKPTHPGQKVASEKKYQRRMAKGSISISAALVQPDSSTDNFKLNGRIVSVGIWRNNVFLRQGFRVRDSQNNVIAAFSLGGAPIPVLKPPAKKKEEKPVLDWKIPLAEINYYGEFCCTYCDHYMAVAPYGRLRVMKIEKSCRICGERHLVYRD